MPGCGVPTKVLNQEIINHGPEALNLKLPEYCKNSDMLWVLFVQNFPPKP